MSPRLGESYPTAEMQSVYSTPPSNLGKSYPIRDVVCVLFSPSRPNPCLGESYSSTKCSLCILHPQPTEASLGKSYSTVGVFFSPRQMILRLGESYPISDVVCVFFSPRQLRHHLEESCPAANMSWIFGMITNPHIIEGSSNNCLVVWKKVAGIRIHWKNWDGTDNCIAKNGLNTKKNLGELRTHQWIQRNSTALDLVIQGSIPDWVIP